MSHEYLLRSGRHQLRTHLGGVACQPATFGDQRVLPQHPIHRGHRTQIAALIEQLGVDLQRSQIYEPLTGQRGQHVAPFQFAQLVDRLDTRRGHYRGGGCDRGVAAPGRRRPCQARQFR